MSVCVHIQTGAQTHMHCDCHLVTGCTHFVTVDRFVARHKRFKVFVCSINTLTVLHTVLFFFLFSSDGVFKVQF